VLSGFWGIWFPGPYGPGKLMPRLRRRVSKP